jgi:hypothetical protein
MAKVFADRSEADLKNKWNSMQRSEKRKKEAAGSALSRAQIPQDAINQKAQMPQDPGVAFSSNEHHMYNGFTESGHNFDPKLEPRAENYS